MTLEQIWQSLEGDSQERRRDWRNTYASRLVITDLCAVIAGVFGTYAVLFSSEITFLTAGRINGVDGTSVTYMVFSIALAAAWMAILALFQVRDYRIIGEGSSEYRVLLNCGWIILSIVALVGFALQIDISRLYVLLALPVTTALLILTRVVWRFWLRSRRRRGQYSSRLIVVGSEVAAIAVARDLIARPEAGYLVVGACLPDRITHGMLGDTEIPVLGSVHELDRALRFTQADTVLVTDGHNMTPTELRTMSWSLEPGRHHLVMVPTLTDIAGPRIHTRPVAGLPLIHVETPKYSGFARFLKRAFDTAVSAGLLFVLSPLFVFCAFAIRMSSPGPIFFRQERIGKWGKPFKMLKFRSMVPDADALLMGLLAEKGDNETPLFKLENDPRITPIGKIMRRYSIDEIPQLVNVFRGQMALVGPRPQVAGEVALYDSWAGRRLIVKPGMTGLWQVSGRSSLSWEQSVRLDLFYVENWSFAGDLVILWRTFRAVVAPGDEAH